MEHELTSRTNFLVETLGYEVHIITTSQKDRPKFFPLSNKIATHDLDIDYESIMKLPLHRRILARIKAKKEHKQKLSKLLAEIQPDISVSMYTHEMSFLPYLKNCGRTVLELHFSKHFRRLDALSNHRSAIHHLINAWLDFSERRVIKRYDRFVVLTHRDAADWGKSYSNISVIPNPCIYKLTESYQLTNNKRVMAAGRLCKQKGFDLLIQAWRLLPESLREEWHLDIFGSGEDQEELQKEINDAGLSDSIILAGRTAEIEKEYASHSIFCFSSRYEGFGMTLMEAMAMGVAPVSFDCPCGPSDLIEDGVSGYLVESENVKEFANRLSHLMENEEDRLRISKNAIKRIELNFTEEIVMNKWDVLFKDLIKS
ncbi:MAG: glycosyltransferase family 4 protein [Lepagella sp.]